MWTLSAYSSTTWANEIWVQKESYVCYNKIECSGKSQWKRVTKYIAVSLEVGQTTLRGWDKTWKKSKGCLHTHCFPSTLKFWLCCKNTELESQRMSYGCSLCRKNHGAPISRLWLTAKALAHMEGTHNFILIFVDQHFGMIRSLGRIHIMNAYLREMQIVMSIVRIYQAEFL